MLSRDDFIKCKKIGDQEILDGDFVVTGLLVMNNCILECIETFSGLEIIRFRDKDAYNASPK